MSTYNSRHFQIPFRTNGFRYGSWCNQHTSLREKRSGHRTPDLNALCSTRENYGLDCSSRQNTFVYNVCFINSILVFWKSLFRQVTLFVIITCVMTIGHFGEIVKQQWNWLTLLGYMTRSLVKELTQQNFAQFHAAGRKLILAIAAGWIRHVSWSCWWTLWRAEFIWWEWGWKDAYHKNWRRGTRYFPQKSTNLICSTQASK